MARRSTRTKRNAVPVQGRWDILPHGMGALPTSASQPANQVVPKQETSGPNSINSADFIDQPDPEKSKGETRGTLIPVLSPINEPKPNKDSAGMVQDENQDSLDTNTPQEPKREAQEIEGDIKGLKQVATLRRSKRIRAQAKGDENDDVEQEASPKRAKTTRKIVKPEVEPEAKAEIEAEIEAEVKAEVKDEVEAEVEAEAGAISSGDLLEKPKRVPRKTKDNPYGLTPGRSPFPDWQAPSAAQCEEVYRLLADTHGEVEQPATIPAPSLEVAGCGEVPSVLDALLRTLLSGAVTFDGADNMMKAIAEKYGALDDELANGSINWNKIRLATMEELEDTIRIGGLANRKSKAIKGTLDMVYQDNIDRREAYLAERATGVPANVYGASEKTESQKDLEILKTDRNILSLDHLHGLSVDEAMKQFTKFPGIGVKTAACVILFCLQQPCFAVDTHVHRFSRWLGWASGKADENSTFSHLEVRCPDHLKYGLHQLFIHHGKQCGRCKGSTVEGTKGWDTIVCPLEHLLVRGKKTTKVQKKTKANIPKANSQEDESDSELSEVNEAIFDDEDFN
ncbi:hypothetical protein E0Z10_g8609 [Xylaria hypoxylon]|uniref:HhH-GPD domain-containing protein n=1 Tax=Xylaria hypoxylon TaxID=37992 RepID=A0A4Z0YL67_9PEZI|nr:hypothetical protein E0Z10_g8609 [Xylaria hypoxylon]